MNDSGSAIERETRYPGFDLYCDLVGDIDGKQCWIELKAFGQFQQSRSGVFLDSFAFDVQKLDGAPPGAGRLALLVVPKNIGGDLTATIRRRWPGIKLVSADVVDVFYLTF